jgi:hypothetical protein
MSMVTTARPPSTRASEPALGARPEYYPSGSLWGRLRGKAAADRFAKIGSR